MTKRARFAPRTMLILGVMIAGVGLLAIPSPLPPAMVWNFSASAPIGLYTVKPGRWSRGDRVAVRPDIALSSTLTAAGVLEKGRLLIKRVAATSGDVACREGMDVRVNGSLVATAGLTTTSGTMLPAWSGCQRLSEGEVFLLGDGDRSFDARYFGVTPAASIIGPVRPIWTPG